MNAFVINEAQLKKMGLVIAGVVLAAFISGYYLGSKQLFSAHKNTPQDVADEVKEPPVTEALKNAATDASLVLPGSNPSLKKDANVKKVEKKKEVKKVDKKSQRKNDTHKKVVIKPVKKKTADKNVTPKKQTIKTKKEKDKKATALAAGAVKPAAKKDAAKKDAAKKDAAKKDTAKKDIVKNNTVKNDAVKNDTLKNDSAGVAGERTYSIQAGMFSSETNANAFIEKLSAKQFDAFISGFVSNSGATKYNVRIGKFAQRDQARELLQEFQKSFSSPAYVVISKP